ncbi:MAG TPA: glycosyltransferase family protein [Candidatus Omnitrophota bacterium]|nr:glycosyltransferase family protein [Candidatus Omnitrophota bacterium]
MKTVAIIQARMGSTRLPGKILNDLGGRPMLSHVVERTSRAKHLDGVVVATTLLGPDDVVAEYCRRSKIPCFRGEEADVLDRYYQTAKFFGIKTIARITADCPFIEPVIVDKMLEIFQSDLYDYVSNTIAPRTFPRGLDAEVFSFSALEKAWKNDKNPAWREHVTPFLYHHPELFKAFVFKNDQDLSDMRWTVDTAEDFEFAKKLYAAIGHNRFLWTDILRLLQKNPDWPRINQNVEQKRAV